MLVSHPQRSDEAFTPPSNLGPNGGLFGQTRFLARQIFDLQVFTVVNDCSLWLRERQGMLLEVGCGDQPYRHLVGKSCKYVGLDIAHGSKTFGTGNVAGIAHYAGGIFPYSDCVFDSVFHTETLEHVIEPSDFLRECARVLRPGGETLFTVPFQARFHYIPFDYWRFTPTALELLVSRAGFDGVRVDARGTDIVVACAKILGVCYRLCVDRLVLILLLGPVIAITIVLAHIMLLIGLGSKNDCLGYTVRARKRL